MTTSAPDRFDLQTAADELGVHYQTAYRWVRSGRLPAARVGGKYLVERAAIDEVVRERATPSAPPVPTRRRLDRSAERLHQQLLDGDEPGARQLIRQLLDDGTPLVELVQSVIVPPLVRIGSDWSDGDLPIWTEHRSSAIVERILGDIVPNPRGRRRGSAVVAAVSGDHHSLPTTMAAVALRDDHWHVQHLGGDVPIDEIIRCCETNEVDLVVITATTPASHRDATVGAERIRHAGYTTIVGAPGKTLDDLIETARQAVTPHAEERR